MPRLRKHNPKRLSDLEQELERVQRAIRREKSQQKKDARAEDARRKIIAGALALEHMEKNSGSEFGKILFRLLDEYTRDHERHLFAFLPTREAPAPPALETEPPTQTEAAA